MSFSHAEDGGIVLDHTRLYSQGRRLRLSPHKAPPPYGSNLYPTPEGLTSKDMILSEDEKGCSLNRLIFHPRNAPRNLDENNQRQETAQLEVEIIQVIGSSLGRIYTPGPQKALCRVIVAPSTSPWMEEHELPRKGQLLFLKIFDALFWHRFVDYSHATEKLPFRVDGAFSDEYAAYHYLYECGLTGSPDLVPEFYGGWTAKVTSCNAAFKDQFRHVAVLAMEFVDGVCLEHLFNPTGPNLETVKLYEDGPAPASFTTDQNQRMKIVAQLMDGTVTQEWLGLHYGKLLPRNVIITMRNESQPLEEPRAVLVDYGNAFVDHLLTQPVDVWKHWPTKPHPLLRFGWHRLGPFRGWVPSEWRGPEHDIDDAPLLDQWTVLRFGPLTGNDEYTTFVTETLPAGAVTEGEPVMSPSRSTGCQLKHLEPFNIERFYSQI
ncbi:hypothetical protein CPLU01_11641 [Colletotrichum plurivorum]|uniref:Protein kinase domain-containing protein n=1 Tax=Colletotrichum plurivorum TaxID=2175906 RepID=A0A8H6K0X9_9PEZI|nr:hypothetical protein CPLU01_11641 [Colletotrichum plurivorum]